MFRGIVLMFAAVILQGCVTPPKMVAQKPAEPSALVLDSAVGGGRQGATFFFLAEVDGVALRDNIMGTSLAASRGQGANLRINAFQRYIPAGKRNLKLSARFAYSAPIQYLFQSGGYEAIDGIVEADLRDGVAYKVNGVMDAFRREIWLEEAASGNVMGEKIVNLASGEATSKAMAGSQYTCCNFRYDGDWISDANWAGLPMIPAGAKIKVVGFGKHKANVLIEGRPLQIGLDYGRAKLTTEQLIAKLVVKDDPKLTISAYPKEIQDAIRLGKVMVGMSKQQAIASLGYPRADATDGIEAAKWMYWTSNDDEYSLVWDEKELLKEVIASPEILEQVEYGK